MLADTGLIVQVEHDSQVPGGEFLAGFARTARDGMHLRAASVRDTCDLVISNVLLIDPVMGVRKTSIGVRRGRICAIGRAGNPDTLDGVEVHVGTGTSVVSGEGLIATAGVIDTHVHTLGPRDGGVARVRRDDDHRPGVRAGLGGRDQLPAGPAHRFAAFDAWPVNIGFLARGSSSRPAPLVEALVEGGACGFKVHDDLGAHARALDTALRVADEHDVQVAIHTDGLNESLLVRDTVAVLDGRTAHAFHVEGCGGGHTPDALSLAGIPNVIGSSMNPTLPFGRDAVAEHFDIILSMHGLSGAVPSNVAIARDHIRARTMGAENVLHDLGVIPITSSDAQGMGRAGETVRRTFCLASIMKASRGADPDGVQGHERHDNERVLRYLAKLTINPAIAHGLADEVGSVEVDKLADLVLWDPARFGATPQLVLKAGFPAWGCQRGPQRRGGRRPATRARTAVRRAWSRAVRTLGCLRE